jgi:transposase-like protein
MNSGNPSLIIANAYAFKEGSKHIEALFTELKNKGLIPYAITMDGERSVMRLIRRLWPYAKIQRCLYHIQMQALIWLREHPKT